MRRYPPLCHHVPPVGHSCVVAEKHDACTGEYAREEPPWPGTFCIPSGPGSLAVASDPMEEHDTENVRELQ